MSIALATVLGLSKNILGFDISVKGVLKFALAALVAFGVWSLYNNVKDIGYRQGVEETTKKYTPLLAAEVQAREKAEKDLAAYKAAYTKWREDQDKLVADLIAENNRAVKEAEARIAAAERRAREKEVIIHEVEKYIPVSADVELPLGFISMWNYSISAGTYSGPYDSAGHPTGIFENAGTPSGVKLSEFAHGGQVNNLECVQRGVIIDSWQKWYTDLKGRNKEIEFKEPIP